MRREEEYSQWTASIAHCSDMAAEYAHNRCRMRIFKYSGGQRCPDEHADHLTINRWVLHASV